MMDLLFAFFELIDGLLDMTYLFLVKVKLLLQFCIILIFECLNALF